HGQPHPRVARALRLVAGRTGRTAAGFAPDGERDRDRQVRPEPAAGLQAGAPVRGTDRGDLPAGRDSRRGMMEKSRKIRLGLAVLLAAGIFGYRYYQDNAGAGATDGNAPAPAAAPEDVAGAAPAPPRMFGDIAFEPCTLSS